MIGSWVAATGWTIRHIEEECTFADLRLLNKHWRKHPPLYILMESLAGYEPPTEARTGFTDQDLAQIPGIALG